MVDSATVSGDDLPAIVAESVIDSIGVEVGVTLGGKSVNLAMLRDPDHWSDDWKAVGVDDVDEFLVGLMESDR